MSVIRKFVYWSFVILSVLSALVSAGCSGAVSPENFEPTIEMLPVTEITRTGAVIAARVVRHGTGNLSYLEFRYGAEGGTEVQATPDNAGGDMYTLRLSGLKPGTSYSCYAVGGTSTATLRSPSVSFTTVPNHLPVVTAPVALSTGPVAIIVEFEIVEDGGDPILTAGCEVTNTVSSGTSRTFLPADCLTPGKHRLHLTGLMPTTHYIITPFASNSLGEAQGEPLEYTTRNSVELKEAGSLRTLLESSPGKIPDPLTISGFMNGDDFRFLRMLLGAPLLPGEKAFDGKVADVDLTDVTITEGGGSFDGSRFTVPDEVSTGLFADCTGLRSVLLPSSAVVLARNALARCEALESLTIAAYMTSVMPSEGCTSLVSIDVSKANTSYAAVDGVLFNRGVTEILWFPLGKGGAYTLPPTVTTIGENAFYETRITGIEIPPSVKSIGRGAFAGSLLEEISLPDGVTNISEGMFQNCTSLTTVRLGKGTEYVGNYVFDGTGVKNLYVAAATPPFAADQAFCNRSASITADCVLHVPAGSRDIYRNNHNWGQFGLIEEYRP